MRHALVSRASFSIAASLVAASLVFAWIASRRGAASAGPPAADDGARAFSQHCKACHGEGELARFLRAAPGLGEAARELEEFLADHGESSAAEDRAIVERLARLASELARDR